MLGHNFDSLQECYDLFMCAATARRLDEAQKEALESEHEVSIDFGPETFQVWQGGATGGVKWVLKNDDLQFFFCTPVTSSGQIRRWAVQVRYLSAGLWEYGIDFLRQRAIACLTQAGFTWVDEAGEVVEGSMLQEFAPSWQRINRVDYAFDFESPNFTNEMRNKRLGERLVLPSGVKYGDVGTSTTLQTITIGMNRANVQIQVYDKGAEITEASGKVWMYKVWEKNGFKPPEEGKPANIWRMEIRFGKDFLKDRGVRTFDEFKEKMQEFFCEAIFKRRLSNPQNKMKREEWPLHPLFAECYRATEQAGKYAPIGRQMTLRHEELKTMLDKQTQGLARSRSVLDYGDYKDAETQQNLMHIGEEIKNAPGHTEKIEKAKERYKHVRDAR